MIESVLMSDVFLKICTVPEEASVMIGFLPCTVEEDSVGSLVKCLLINCITLNWRPG